jgi:glutathione S-transferase
MYQYTALVTVLGCLLYFYTTVRVGQARTAFGVKVPATTGDPDFERVFRVQMNMLEWMPLFLAGLWLFAVYISDAIAALLGVAWIVGRVLYIFAYSQAAEKRGLGFAVQALAGLALLIGALVAILWRILHG